MRINLLTCCLLFLIAAACTTPDNKVYLTGNIVVPQGEKYELYLQEQGQNIPLQADSIQGNFSLELNCDSSHIVNLFGVFGKNDEPWPFSQPLYLTPGKKINIQLHPGKRIMEVKFDSKDQNNNALKAYQDYYLKHSEELWTATPEPGNAGEFLMGFCQKAGELISQYDPAPEVAQYLTIFGYLEYMKGIEQLKFIYRKDPDKKISQELYNAVPALEKMLDNTTALLFSDPTQTVILDYLTRSTSQPEEQIQLLQQKFTQPEIIKVTIRNILQRYLLSYDYTQKFEEGLARLKNMCNTLPEDKEQFIKDFSSKKYSVEGADLPEATIEDKEGKQYKLSDLKGDNLYIDLWASWCVPCCQEVPYLQKLEKQVRNKSVKFISISLDENKAAWKNRMEQLHMEGAQFIVVGKELANMLNVQGIPHFLIYSKDGKLLHYKAPRPSTGKTLIEMLNQLH